MEDLNNPEKNGRLKNILDAFEHLEVGALVSIGGDDTLKTANYLWLMGFPVIHIPRPSTTTTTVSLDLRLLDRGRRRAENPPEPQGRRTGNRQLFSWSSSWPQIGVAYLRAVSPRRPSS